MRDLEVFSGFSLRGRRVVELNVLADALDGGCEACSTALRLSNCINETVTGLDCYFTHVVQTPSVERGIFPEQIRPTRTTRGRPIFDVNTKLAAEFTFRFV